MAEALNTEVQHLAVKLDEYEKKCQEQDREIENYKKHLAKLEDDLANARKLILQRATEADEVDSLKIESEKTLTKAKSIIFERTKVIKNQELQIEAYAQQIDSLKDVVRITKDLLEIRNLEVKQLETKIKCMEEKVKAEKERQDLLHKKLETMIRHNGELKREYETQLCLFSALRERYSERELAKDIVDEMKGVKTPEAGSSVTVSDDCSCAPGISVTITNKNSRATPSVNDSESCVCLLSTQNTDQGIPGATSKLLNSCTCHASTTTQKTSKSTTLSEFNESHLSNFDSEIEIGDAVNLEQASSERKGNAKPNSE